MALATQTLSQAHEIDRSTTLGRLATLPEWLLAALQPKQIVAALDRHVPEFRDGTIELRGCKVKRLLLKGDSGRWTGTYTLTIVERASGQKQTVALDGVLTPPHMRAANGATEPAQAFGTSGWRCTLPELGLELEAQPPEAELIALPQLTDPELSCALLEQAIGAGAAYHDLRIASCTPNVLSYKPGSRCTILYQLAYAPEAASGSWPTTVIAKTYRKDSKARNAYDGMWALWKTPLAQGDVVKIAEPLAYISELKLMVQGPIAGANTLEDLLRDALRDDTPERMEQLYGFMRKTAAGLAALHQSGARHGAEVTLEGRFPGIRELIDRLAVPEPELRDAAMPLLAELESFAAAHPAGAPVPTHGTFNPEQVMIDGQQIGFIDFDDFCMAEPALDVGLFCSAIRDTGMNAGDDAFFADRAARLARLDQLDAICEVFIAEYARHAPLSRQRVVLWQALDFLRNCLHYWIKVKPAEPNSSMLVLDRLLADLGR